MIDFYKFSLWSLDGILSLCSGVAEQLSLSPTRTVKSRREGGREQSFLVGNDDWRRSLTEPQIGQVLLVRADQTQVRSPVSQENSNPNYCFLG